MKATTIYILILLASSLFSIAQSKTDKKNVRRAVREAEIEMDERNYFNAWQLYRKALYIDPKHQSASVNAVACMFHLNYPIDSAASFSENLAGSSEPGSRFYLARLRHQQRKIDEALNLLEEYSGQGKKKRIHSEDEIRYLRSVCVNAKKMISAPRKSIIKNLGAEVNSPYPDYVPVIVPDESALYFTSKRSNPEHPEKNGDNTYFEDVYVCYKENDRWKKAESVGNPINSITNDGCVAVSPDGQRMIVYRTSADQLSGDLYITSLGPQNRWQPLQLMTGEINSPYTETSACFSNDTSEIYFSSDRPGGFGGKDLYRIRKLPTGNWSLPLNLGANINTRYDEDAPFLHPDGVTLYYSSKGPSSMGEFDVFKSVLDADSMRFSLSENLGYPINDVGNDIFFVLSVDGQRGYYSSTKKETVGGADIYQIDTRFGENDLKVLHGVGFLDGKAGRIQINLYDKDTDQLQGMYVSNFDTGKFILVVNPLKGYRAVVESDDFPARTYELQPFATKQTEEVLVFKLEKQGEK